jgi:hypothetical protein
MSRLPHGRTAPPRRAGAALTLALALTIGPVAAACSGGSDPTPSGQAGSSGTPAPGAGAGATGGSGGSDAEGAPTPSRTTQFTAPGRDAGRIEVGFVGLVVDNRLAVLTLTLTPRYDRAPADPDISIFKMFGQHSPGVTLLDTADLKRYVVVRDSAGVGLEAAAATTRTRNNVPVSASYTFAAPPAGLSSIDVYVDDRLVFDDAAITR